VAARYLVAYRVKRDGTPRPKSSLAEERTCLNVYILPALGNAWISDLDLPELNATVRRLTRQDGTPASGSTKSTVASVLRRSTGSSRAWGTWLWSWPSRVCAGRKLSPSPIGNVNLDGQSIMIDRTASESGGRRDVREDMKTRAAERTVMIPDIAMPALHRLADRGAA
jgi:hypothetical protein